MRGKPVCWWWIQIGNLKVSPTMLWLDSSTRDYSASGSRLARKIFPTEKFVYSRLSLWYNDFVIGAHTKKWWKRGTLFLIRSICPVVCVFKLPQVATQPERIIIINHQNKTITLCENEYCSKHHENILIWKPLIAKILFVLMLLIEERWIYLIIRL